MVQPKPQRCCGRAPRPSRQVRRCTRRRSKRPAPLPLPRTKTRSSARGCSRRRASRNAWSTRCCPSCMMRMCTTSAHVHPRCPGTALPRQRNNINNNNNNNSYAAPRLARWRQRSRPSRPPERIWEAMWRLAGRESGAQAAHTPESHHSARAGRRPQPPNRAAMAGPRLTAPKPLLSSRALSLVGAPAFSSPPASQQQQWQKVRLDGALEAQRRGPPPRDAGDADGGGGAAAVATATAAAAATSRSCPTMTNKTKYNHRNLQQRMRRILSWRSRKRASTPRHTRHKVASHIVICSRRVRCFPSVQ